MSDFPPKSAKKNVLVISPDTPAVSTGNGGIPASLKIKAAGTHGAPGAGPDKTVQQF